MKIKLKSPTSQKILVPSRSDALKDSPPIVANLPLAIPNSMFLDISKMKLVSVQTARMLALHYISSPEEISAWLCAEDVSRPSDPKLQNKRTSKRRRIHSQAPPIYLLKSMLLSKDPESTNPLLTLLPDSSLDTRSYRFVLLDVENSDSSISEELESKESSNLDFESLNLLCKKKLKLDFSIDRLFPSNSDISLFNKAHQASSFQLKNENSEILLRDIEKKQILHPSADARQVKDLDLSPIFSRLRPREKPFIQGSSSPASSPSSPSFSSSSIIYSIDLQLRLDEPKSASPPALNKPFLSQIVLGDLLMDVWYTSPYPAEYISGSFSILYVCPWCLKYLSSPFTYQRHIGHCIFNGRKPPGSLIFSQDSLTIYEIDGSKNRLYCQNLCLLAKCFLEHKILYYDVNAFLFYVLCERYTDGDERIVGYFSKERNPEVNNNVSCIVVFPAYQGKGYGQYLIDFSYALSRLENRIGGPETPLSDLGFISYAKYWMEVIIHEFHEIKPYSGEAIPSWTGRCALTYLEMSKTTGIMINHILTTLEWMECLVRTRDGRVAVNFERIARYKDVLKEKKRPIISNILKK